MKGRLIVGTMPLLFSYPNIRFLFRTILGERERTETEAEEPDDGIDIFCTAIPKQEPLEGTLFI